VKGACDTGSMWTCLFFRMDLRVLRGVRDRGRTGHGRQWISPRHRPRSPEIWPSGPRPQETSTRGTPTPSDPRGSRPTGRSVGEVSAAMNAVDLHEAD